MLQLCHNSGNFRMLLLRCGQGRLLRDSVLGREGPVPVSAADLLDFDEVLVGEVLEVVWGVRVSEVK